MSPVASKHRRGDAAASRHELSIYDGRTLLGHVREEGSRCRATTWPDGYNLGEFPNREGAVDAIGKAAQQTGGRAK